MSGYHYNRLIEEAARHKIPISVAIEITHCCSFKCQHCFVWRNHNSSAELSTEKWLEILKQLRSAGTLFLTITGGEPFMRTDLKKIAETAVEMGFNVTLFTNGYSLRENDAQWIANSGIAIVEISFYSSEPAIFDKITGVNGSYKRVMDNIKKLKSLRVPLKLKTPMMKDNFKTLPKTHRYLTSLGINFFIDTMLMPDCRNPESNRHEVMSVDDFRNAIKLCRSFLSIPTDEKREDSNYTLCSAGHSTCSISFDGSVYPCPLFLEKAGDLNKESFAEIWEHSLMFKKLRSLRRSVWKKCLNCSIRSVCRRCPAFSLATGGTVEELSDTICILNRIYFDVLKKES